MYEPIIQSKLQILGSTVLPRRLLYVFTYTWRRPVHEQFANEMKVVGWLKEEMQRVLNLIGTRGEPEPHQAARLLQQYTTSVTTLIPYSPKVVKDSVIVSRPLPLLSR